MTESLAARWEQHHEAGRRSFAQGQLAEAERAFHEAVREAELLGPESAQLASSLSALGQIRTQQKDYSAAEPLLTHALSIREKVFGTEGHVLVPTLNSLAALHDARGEYERAETLLRRALGISEHHLGPAHPEVSVGLNSLAKLYFKRRDFAKADRLLLRLLEIKRGLGKDHPEVATVLGSLAKLRQVVGKHDQGEQLWRQALAIRERCFAPNDAVIATTLENLSDCCAPIPGRVAEAIALRERALTIRESSPSTNAAAAVTARVKLEELRGRLDSAPPPQPPPRRSSQELPSPLISQDAPAALSDDAPRPRPSADLPWLDIEDADRISGQFNVMMTPTLPMPPMPPTSPTPPTRRSTPAASVTPLGVPRQSTGISVPGASTAPAAPALDLVLSDSIVPEPPARETTSGRAARYVAPSEARKTASGRGARYVAPDPDSTRVETRARTPRMPVEMSRRGSSKRLVATGMLVIALAGGAWVARGQLSAMGVPFMDRLSPVAAGASPVVTTAPPRTRRVATPVPRIDSAAPATPASTGGAIQRTTPADSVVHDLSPSGQLAATDTRLSRPRAAAARLATVGDSTVRIKRASNDEALQLSRVPAVGEISATDVVTSDVEQATKSKVESAQHAQIDAKSPVFKKP